MGKAIALLFAEEGAQVIAADIQEARLAALKEEAAAKPGKVHPIVTNVAIEEDIERMVDSATQIFGTLDILVNNAGIMDHFAPVGDLDNAMWEKVMKVNVDGPFKAMRSAMKIFLGKGSGIIINIASIGGLMGARAGAAYTTSKHALIGLTKNTGYLYSKSGIRCNAIAPGAVATNISETIDFSKVGPLANERILSGMVLNPRTAEPNEIATVALFLASEESSFINGAVITADGGWTAY
jgi:NAD(P)-dependent dehydrogenase (short-subunit alcohol dehydrogenase family)